MKINPIAHGDALRAYGSVNRTSKQSACSSGVDEVSFSETAVSFSKILASARESAEETTSADEAARVAQIAEQVREGTYHIDSLAVAEKLISMVMYD